MSKLANTITMLKLLENGKKYSIKELADILEISKRMVRIYKEDLEKSGIYIDSIKGPYGGYVLNQNIRIPTRKFCKEDIKLIDSLIGKENDISTKESLFILKDKIRGIYIGSKEETIELDLKNDNKNKYNIISKAIIERKKIMLQYYSFKKGEQKRVIHPKELFLYCKEWYVLAFCESKNDNRHFELKRIISIELLKENF